MNRKCFGYLFCDKKGIISDYYIFKMDSAYHRVKELNSTINMKVYRERLTSNNCRDVLKECDIIIDAVDNIDTRKLNTICISSFSYSL